MRAGNSMRRPNLDAAHFSVVVGDDEHRAVILLTKRDCLLPPEAGDEVRHGVAVAHHEHGAVYFPGGGDERVGLGRIIGRDLEASFAASSCAVSMARRVGVAKIASIRLLASMLATARALAAPSAESGGSAPSLF